MAGRTGKTDGAVRIHPHDDHDDHDDHGDEVPVPHMRAADNPDGMAGHSDTHMALDQVFYTIDRQCI